MMQLPVPTIHLNGTSQNNLLDAVVEARAAVQAAVEALTAASPNGRDYYPQGAGAFEVADGWFRKRIAALSVLADDLQELAMAIADGGKR